ncbi:MAG: nucleotidyltransferase domain-containing protein [Candidatus Aminicenantales bacterium]
MEGREAGRLLCDFLSRKNITEAGLGTISPADWENLVDWALCFKVGGLFYRETRSGNFPAELIPIDARDRLREAYRNLATTNTSRFFDVLKILKALADNRLPVIELKGLSLANKVYGDIALRPMSDVDLLVKEEDLVKAGRILLTLGYQQYFPSWERVVKIYHHLPPFTNKNGTMIELHWNIVAPDSPIKVDLDGLWERSRLINVDHVKVRAFSPEDIFLYLCIHAGFHLKTGLDLIPFCDMAGLIKNPTEKIDWPIVMERATRWGCQKCVYLMMVLVRNLLGAAPPDIIMLGMEPDDYQSVYFDEALEQIFNDNPSDRLIRKRIDQLSQIRKYKGIKCKILSLSRVAFPSREYMARIYPVSVSSPKIFLYYIFRLGRLVVHYATVLLRWFRHDQSTIKAVHREHRTSAVSDWMFS